MGLDSQPDRPSVMQHQYPKLPQNCPRGAVWIMSRPIMTTKAWNSQTPVIDRTRRRRYMVGGEKEGKRCELQLPGVANVTMRRGQEVNRVLGTLKEAGSGGIVRADGRHHNAVPTRPVCFRAAGGES